MERTTGTLGFGSFAAGHLALSLAWGMLFLFSPIVLPWLFERRWYMPVLTALSMLSYLPAGWRTARKRNWDRPDRNTSLRAIFLPALIGWSWAGLGLAFLYLGIERVCFHLGLVVLAPLLLLASPSALFGIQAFASLPLPVNLFLAGLLPSLLFWLGSWLAVSASSIQNVEPLS